MQEKNEWQGKQNDFSRGTLVHLTSGLCLCAHIKVRVKSFIETDKKKNRSGKSAVDIFKSLIS